MKYRVTYMARRTGASGQHYPVKVDVDATSERDAKEQAFDKLHNDGYETVYPSLIEESPCDSLSK